MKKLVVPLFLFLLVVLTGGLMYGSTAVHYYHKPEYKEYSVSHEVSIKQAEEAGVKVQPNAEYSLVYKLREYRSTQGFKIKRRFDTIDYYLLAQRIHAPNEQPLVLPTWEEIKWEVFK